jgi:trigger factor
VIDFKGSVDGELFEGGSAEDYPLVLGSKSFIPGFEDQLVGAKAGDEVSVNVTFPEGYGAKHLAGKAAVFACTVKAVNGAEGGRDRRRDGQEVRRRGAWPG